MQFALFGIAACTVAIGGVAQQQKPRPALKFTGSGSTVTGILTNKDVLSAALVRLHRPRTRSAVLSDDPAAAKIDGETFLVINVEFDTEAHCAAYNVPEAPHFARSGKYLDAFIPSTKTAEASAAIDKVVGIIRLDVVDNVTVPPTPKPGSQGTRSGTPEQIVRGGISGLTGKGVIVAIVDSGVDFRNPDFIKYVDGKPVSRLLYMWDTTKNDFSAGQGGSKPPISYPNGVGVGTIYTQDQLTADLQLPKSVIGARDTNGHGTSCAGIAAGNGNSLVSHQNIGVAPEADIIAVRIGSSSGSGLDFGWTLNAACEWMDKVAGSQPLVVSCSFGGQNGRHDGRSIEELELTNRFPDTKRGRAIVVAAGNEGSQKIHAEATFGNMDKSATISWTGAAGTSISLHFDTDELKDLRFVGGEGTKLPKLSATVDNATKQATIPLNKLAEGKGSLKMYTESGRKVVCDAYITDGTFDDSSVTYSKLVGRPGTAAGVITVGSYDWNDQFHMNGALMVVTPGSGPLIMGKLSNYSSVGPSRDFSAMKPDLVAPGQYYAASAPLNPTTFQRDTTNKYQLFNGTSAATPYVAGVIALMFEKKPSLLQANVKGFLHGDASADAFTGSCPNSKWGYGKLNLDAVKKIISEIR